MASTAHPVDVAFDPRRNAIANKVHISDEAAHRWYRFVLSFPPHLVREYLEAFGCDRSSRVLDPFAGTGTTLVEARKLGIRSAGVEALPMAHFASSVKLDWSPRPDRLISAADDIATKTLRALKRDGLSDQGQDELPARFEPLAFTAEQDGLLLADSISPLPLHKTLRLKQSIFDIADSGLESHLLLALANSTVRTASNLRFGPEVGLGLIKKDAVVISSWLKEVSQMARDLEALDELPGAAAKIYRADSRKSLRRTLGERTIDAVVTSPPYPNEKDYTRTTRLESVLLDLIGTRKQLRELKKQLVRSNTRSVYREDEDHRWVEDFEEIQDIARRIEDRRLELGKTSGFERQYARVTKLYFGGMARHLEELKRVLKPGALLAYVVGDQASYLQVMIRTGQILGRIAETLGYEVVSIDLFRTRLSTATGEQLREEVLVLRAPK
jgi:DNA modification methylase